MSDAPLRIAMWSGPRNISTALLRSWGNRSDTAVWDEPLYAFYLKETGIAHPGAAEVIAHHEPDWQKVVAALVGPGRDVGARQGDTPGRVEPEAGPSGGPEARPVRQLQHDQISHELRRGYAAGVQLPYDLDDEATGDA